MSVSAVHMFYNKIATDMMMRAAFIQATSASVIAFAADRGHMFTAYDLQQAGETLQDQAKQVSDDVKQLVEHQQKMGKIGKAAADAVAKGASAASGKAGGMDANSLMTDMLMQSILERLREVANLPLGRQKSGGG